MNGEGRAGALCQDMHLTTNSKHCRATVSFFCFGGVSSRLVFCNMFEMFTDVQLLIEFIEDFQEDPSSL